MCRWVLNGPDMARPFIDLVFWFKATFNAQYHPNDDLARLWPQWNTGGPNLNTMKIWDLPWDFPLRWWSIWEFTMGCPIYRQSQKIAAPSALQSLQRGPTASDMPVIHRRLKAHSKGQSFGWWIYGPFHGQKMKVLEDGRILEFLDDVTPSAADL